MQLPDQLFQLAPIIEKDWTKMYFGASPYVKAMYSLHSISDHYGEDSAKSIVLYFLANARTWRGETAKAVKEKLHQLVKNAR